jgi:putative DNA primase/helicase
VRRALADLGLLGDDGGSHRAGDARPSAPKVAAQPVSEERLARAQRIWNESGPIRHTLAAAYLKRRAIADVCRDTPALRFHPSMTSLEDRTRRPALVAAITDDGGALQGVQVTLLTPHGAAKAAIATPRRVIGKLVGGVVRLSDAGDHLAVGEGVETMLSASAAIGLPAWAALTAYNLSLFTPPAEVTRLVIAADNDSAGLAAAEAVRARLSIDVAVRLPPAGAEDWNRAAETPG